MLLNDLKQKMINCRDCILSDCRTQIVFGEGNPKAKILIISEAPGEEEDIAGKPFVGKAGKKLNSILGFLNLKRDDIYILNSVLCRPPNNRIPTNDELNACRWRFLTQIEIINPEIILVLGKTALKQLLGIAITKPLNQFFTNEGFRQVTLNGKIYNIMVSWHPSFHLRSPNYAYETSLPHFSFLKEWLKKN